MLDSVLSTPATHVIDLARLTAAPWITAAKRGARALGASSIRMVALSRRNAAKPG